MNIPKIEFRKMTLEECVDLAKWGYFETEGPLNVREYTIKCYPELSLISKNESKEKIYNIIEAVVSKKYQEEETVFFDEANRYSLIWNKYSYLYYQSLQKLLNIDWPIDKPTIQASVGIAPVFPRYLDYFSFSVAINLEESKIVETCAHESLHFLWFEKWKELYPNTKREEFDAPYLVWQYSEMAVDVILNSNIIKDILKIDSKAYNSFYEMKYNVELVMEHLNQIYLSETSIEDKIITGFEYIKKIHQDKIN